MPSGMPPTENLGNQKCQSGHEQKSGTQDVLVWEKTESPSGFSESKEWWHLEVEEPRQCCNCRREWLRRFN